MASKFHTPRACETGELLDGLLRSRSSVRAFLPQPLTQAQIDELFSMAQKAPSWCNIQPWRLTLTIPPATDVIRDALLAAAQSTNPSPEIDFPEFYADPYAQRRKECGIGLYRAMGVSREDKVGRHDAWLRNYAIFDAPHLLVVSRNISLGEYATLDVGVWLGTFLLAAESLGIHTCAMASIAGYPQPLRKLLNISEEESILCCVAIGKADLSKKVNSVRTTRQEVGANLRLVSTELCGSSQEDSLDSECTGENSTGILRNEN